MEYPKSFLKKYEQLLDSCPYNHGRSEAAFLAGNYDGIDDILFRFTQNTEYPDFVKKAKRVYQEHTKLVNFNKLKETGDITTQQYCDLFIRHIYDLAKEKGLDTNLRTDEVKDFFGIKGYREWRNIFDILVNMDLIETILETESGSIIFQINGKGLHYVESGGSTGVIKAFLTNSNVYQDHSVNIGTNYGQAFTGSTNVSQYLTIENPKHILDKLENMKNILFESEMDADEKEDAIATIVTVENELKKKKPVTAIVFGALQVLANVATIGPYAYDLAKILGIPLP